MKQKVLFFTIFLIQINTFAQSTSKNRLGEYKWNTSVVMTRCLIDGKTDTAGLKKGFDTIQISEPNQIFKVIEVLNNQFAIIKIVDYTHKAKDTTISITPSPKFYVFNYKKTPDDYLKEFNTNDKRNSRNYGTDQIYFKVSLDVLDAYASSHERIGPSLTAGVLNFPFKYRPQKGNIDFSGSFNFGTAIGFTFPHPVNQKFIYSIVTGYSISNIMLDSSTIGNNTPANQAKLQSNNGFTAFSFSLGGLIEYERIQVGLFIGWDRIGKLNDATYDWKFQGKPWLSIGLGYSIFSASDKTIKTNNTPQQP